MHDKCHHKVQLPILPTLKLGIVFYYKVRRLLYKTVRQVSTNYLIYIIMIKKMLLSVFL